MKKHLPITLLPCSMLLASMCFVAMYYDCYILNGKRKPTTLPTVITVLVLVSLCKAEVLICAASTKAINADEWLEMVSLFQSSLNRKFPLSRSTSSLYQSDRGRQLHTSLLSLWNSVLLICFQNERKMKNNKVWRKLVCMHKNTIFYPLLIVVQFYFEHNHLKHSGRKNSWTIEPNF